MSVWIQTYKGRTQVNVEKLLELEPKLKEVSDQFKSGGLSRDAAERKIIRLVGTRRLDADWEASNAARPCPPDRLKGSFAPWSLQVFEEWLASQPEEYKKLYIHEDVACLAILGVPGVPVEAH